MGNWTPLISGIGAAVARLLLHDTNNRVVAVARSGDKLNQLQQEFPGRLIAIAGDVNNSETSQRAVKAAVEEYGQLDSVVANAGILHPVDTVADAKVDEWKKAFDINFFAVVDLLQVAIPELRKSKFGNVVAVLSGASRAGYFAWGAYGSSKAALDHLIGTVAAEEKLVHTISIAPGVVDTEMQGDIRTKFSDNMKESAERFHDLHKSGSLLLPDVPATVLANLALKGWLGDLNGKYFRYNDEQLKEYTK